MVCLNNLRQIGGAVLNYHTTNEVFPPGTTPNAALPPDKRLSWLTALPPFMEQKTKDAQTMKGLSDQLDPDLAWDEEVEGLCGRARAVCFGTLVQRHEVARFLPACE